MDRNRLILRLAIIAVAVGVFLSRGGLHKPDAMLGFFAALGLALVVVIVRAVMESKKKQQAERDRQAIAEGKKVDLFTKPKDF